jgi:UDP-N-acetylenolpyruvoylglucosamine reductase
LIDDLGLKGQSVGKAVVSEVHGNFIVNQGGATSREVLDLVAQIKEKALQERGVSLEMEVKVIGEDQPLPL